MGSRKIPGTSIKILKGEEWRDVVGYEGLYLVSNRGRFVSCAKTWYAGAGRHQKRTKKANIVKPHYGTFCGEATYNHITLCKNGKVRDAKVCKLEAQAFLPNPLKKKCVNHKDGKKWNDRLNNLEWATHKENTEHMVRTGLRGKPNGEINGMSKLKAVDVRLIRKLAIKTDYSRLAKRFNVSEGHIYNIVRRIRWKHI